MTKLGDDYQELVGAVEKALDPGATVRVGVWVIGPDGRRDLDVEVRGTIEGRPQFIQIECKDWAKPVGISVVDALDSKRRDFGADRAIIYSNSGFTEPAMKKAARLDIGMASVLKAGDQRIKIVVHKELVAKRLSVDHVRVVLYPPSDSGASLPDSWALAKLAYDELPVQNWLAQHTCKLLTEHEPNGALLFACTFRLRPAWTYANELIEVAAMRVFLQCSRSWVSQMVREDVTLGVYDHVRKAVMIPSKQGYYLRCIDREAWLPFDSVAEEQQLASTPFSLNLTLLNPIPAIDDACAPNLDAIILEQEVKLVT